MALRLVRYIHCKLFRGIGMPPLEGRVFAMEGDAAARRLARQMVRTLAATCCSYQSPEKLRITRQLRWLRGQVLALMEAAANVMMSLGIKRRDALRALLPLTRQVLDNFGARGPARCVDGAACARRLRRDCLARKRTR